MGSSLACVRPETEDTDMNKWWGSKPIVQSEFESQQDKLQRMSAEVVKRYRKELNQEVSEPDRLAAVYGMGFATADGRRQAQVVCLLASSMLKAPNTDVTLVWPDRQESVASVRGGEVSDEWSSALEDSYCSHVITTGRELSVEKSREHPLVCDTSFARAGQIVSYLGVPVANREGIIVGVLCAHDTVSRQWNTADVGILTQLSVVLTRAMTPVAAS
jgi:GAF domain-containing protein